MAADRPSDASPVLLLDALSGVLSSSLSSSENLDEDLAPDLISLYELAAMVISPPLVVISRLMIAVLLSRATTTPALMPMAALPSAPACAVPSATAAEVIVCVEETFTLPEVVIFVALVPIEASAVLRAAVTAASGTMDTEPAPAPLASVSVDDDWIASTVRLSAPVTPAPPSSRDCVTFLWVAMAIDAPMPSVPPSPGSISSLALSLMSA